MLARRLKILGIVLFAVLLCPRPSQADFLDFIWEMSGSQMIGFGVVNCQVDLRGGGRECRILDLERFRFAGQIQARSERRVWIAFDGTVYFSTGKNSDGDDYRAFRNYMVSLEPVLVVRPYSGAFRRVYHGVIGASYNVLKGTDHDLFHKGGLKLRPIAVAFGDGNALTLSSTVRIYPRGFTPVEFGFPPHVPDRDRDWERLYGFSVGWAW